MLDAANYNDYRQRKVCILSLMSKSIDIIGIDYHCQTLAFTTVYFLFLRCINTLFLPALQWLNSWFPLVTMIHGNSGNPTLQMDEKNRSN